MMKYRTLGVYVLLFLLTACRQNQTSNQKYFDFDRLIDDQISELSQRRRVLGKVADIDGSKSDTTFLPSVKGWETELEIFRELEKINKPASQLVYKIEDRIEDSKSNLLIRRYAAASEPVPLVEFYYQNEFSRLKKIEASVAEKNVLYSAQRVLKIEFDEGEEGHPLLIRYSMEGFQKMFMRDTVHLSMVGEIDW